MRGEQLIRCNPSPMNICGSDMVIYKSECDFLASKNQYSDLTILDLADCIGSDSEVVGSNSTEGVLSLDSRSLRGSSGTSRAAPELYFGNTSVLLENETHSGLAQFVDVKSGNHSLLAEHAGQVLALEPSLDGSFHNSSMANATHTRGDNATSTYYTNNHSPVFKTINKFNVNVINAVVDNFDISSFVLSNGRYNLSRLSLSILEAILRILRSQRSRMQNLLDQMKRAERTENGNSTGLKSLEMVDEEAHWSNFTLANSSTPGQRMHNGLNVTFRLTNSGNTTVGGYWSSPAVVDIALQTLNRMGVNGWRTFSNDSVSETTAVNGSAGIVGRNRTANRMLLTHGEDYIPFLDFGIFNETNNYLAEAQNCDLGASSSRETPVASSFHCVFPRNSTGSLRQASKQVLNLTEFILRNSFEQLGLGSTLTGFPVSLSHSVYNSSLEREDLLGSAKARVLSATNQSEGAVNQTDSTSDMLDVLLAPLNSTSDDLRDIGIDEIFVNFDLDIPRDNVLVEELESADPLVSKANILEELNEIFKLDSLIKSLSGRKALNDTFSNHTLSGSLRSTREELLPSFNSSLIMDDLFREFPPAFDRVRGENCIVKCNDQVDYHCANNGVTYRNLCEFRNAQCVDSNLIFVSFGKCLPLVIRG